MKPVITTFAGEIGNEASDEIKEDFEPDDEFNTFVDDYLIRFVERHIESSVGQLEEIANEKRAVEQESATLADDVGVRVDEWSDTRPDKVADRETNQLSNAIATFIFFGAGFSTVWRIRGPKTCPYCRELEGKRISSGGSFLNAGDELDPKGGTGPMIIRGLKKHPPLHTKCDCYTGAI